jgi:SPP1 family predicted phage head-tail adaptor
MLSATEVAAMRAIQGEALPDTCSRERVTLTADGTGGHTQKTDTQSYACRVAPTSGRDLEIAARLTSAVTFTVTLPWDADVISEDALLIGGRRLEVIAPLVGGAWQTALRVLAVEVTG